MILQIFLGLVILFKILSIQKKIEYPIYKIGDSLILGTDVSQDFRTLPYHNINFYGYNRLLTDRIKLENPPDVQLEMEIQLRDDSLKRLNFPRFLYGDMLVKRRENNIDFHLISFYHQNKDVIHLDYVSEESKKYFLDTILEGDECNPLKYNLYRRLQIFFLDEFFSFIMNTNILLFFSTTMSVNKEITLNRNDFWYDTIKEQIGNKSLVCVQFYHTQDIVQRLKNDGFIITKYNYQTKSFDYV